MDIFKGVSPWILSKNLNFCYGCFSQKLSQKKIVFRYSGYKIMIIRPKILSFKKGKFLLWLFFTEIVSEKIVVLHHRFCPKI